jgi:hypothetical protein
MIKHETFGTHGRPLYGLLRVTCNKRKIANAREECFAIAKLWSACASFDAQSARGLRDRDVR